MSGRISFFRATGYPAKSVSGAPLYPSLRATIKALFRAVDPYKGNKIKKYWFSAVGSFLTLETHVHILPDIRGIPAEKYFYLKIKSRSPESR